MNDTDSVKQYSRSFFNQNCI